jgi:hypothetical protein
MAGITLAQAQARLDQYLAAEEAVLLGQQYEIGGRMLRRADLQAIQEGIRIWDDRVEKLSAKAAGRVRAISPRVGF